MGVEVYEARQGDQPSAVDDPRPSREVSGVNEHPALDSDLACRPPERPYTTQQQAAQRSSPRSVMAQDTAFIPWPIGTVGNYGTGRLMPGIVTTSWSLERRS